MNHQEVGRQLLNMKKKIEDAKSEAARLEGQIAQLEHQRATDLGCATDAEAEEYIKELEQDIARMEGELSDGIAAIKEELGW